MPHPHPVEAAREAAEKGPNIGQTIVEHVSNSSLDHPLIHLPKVFGIGICLLTHRRALPVHHEQLMVFRQRLHQPLEGRRLQRSTRFHWSRVGAVPHSKTI